MHKSEFYEVIFYTEVIYFIKNGGFEPKNVL